jgi:hypothetical protein
VGTFFGLALSVGAIDAAAAGFTAQKAYELGFFTVLGTASTWLLLQESTSERQIRALRADPLWQGISVAAAPAPGGFRLALSWRF